MYLNLPLLYFYDKASECSTLREDMEKKDLEESQNPDYMFPTETRAPINYDGNLDIGYVEQFKLNMGKDDPILIQSWAEIRDKAIKLIALYHYNLQDGIDAACLCDVERNVGYNEKEEKLVITSGYLMPAMAPDAGSDVLINYL